MDDLLLNLVLAGLAGYVLKLWLDDTRRLAGESGPAPGGTDATDRPAPKPLPGASWASRGLLIVSALLGVGMCLGATAVEAGAGWLEDQREIALSFVLAMLGAAVIEELIFRGYLVIENRGRALLIGGAVAASLLFALLHPYLWHAERTGDGWGPASWTFTLSQRPADFFFTATIFANSLLFYALRLGPWNPSRSLLPAIVAHAAYNLSVFAVKLACGKVVLG